MRWREEGKVVTVLAPMEDVTDTVFRRLVGLCGRPSILVTEFTSAEGMRAKGSEDVKQRLRFWKEEKPLVAQLWGTQPEAFLEAAAVVREMGFDGIDLNMGCPAAKIVKKGACAGLIEQPERAAAIIRATKEGAKDLPVSVKTRLGFREVKTLEWAGFLLDQGIDALILHARIAAQMSEGRARWEEIPQVVELRDRRAFRTAIIGNGDVQSVEEAEAKASVYGVDGVMIGRGIFGDLFLFHPSYRWKDLSERERLSLLVAHLRWFEAEWRGEKPFGLLKRFFKNYLGASEGLRPLLACLMESSRAEEVEPVIERSWADQREEAEERRLPPSFWKSLPPFCHVPRPLPW